MKIINRIFYSIALLLIVAIILIIVATNSSWVIDKAAKRFAPEYGISYSSISGNIFNGVTITNLAYQDKKLCSDMTFRWNPVLLLDAKLYIDKLILKDINKTAIEYMIAGFATDDNTTEDNTSSSDDTNSSFKLSVIVNQAYLSALSFSIDGIDINQSDINATLLTYKDSKIGFKEFDVSINSNLAKLRLISNWQKDKLLISKLDITKIDTTSIMKLSENNTSSDENSSQDTNDSIYKALQTPLIPNLVEIKQSHIDMLPTVYKPVVLDDMQLDISDMSIEPKKQLIKKSKFDLAIKTNLSHIKHKGVIIDNKYMGHMDLKATNHLFELYKLPVRKGAIGDVYVDFDINKTSFKATILSSAKQILQTKDSNGTKEFNMDIPKLQSDISYNFKNSHINAKSIVWISTPYAKDINITNDFIMDNHISYSGDIYINKITNLDKNITDLVKNLKLTYKGTTNLAHIDINSSKIQGYVDTKDMRHIVSHLQTNDYILLKHLVSLPPKLKKAKAKVTIDVPLDLNHTENITAKAKIVSNLVDMDSDINYSSKHIKALSKITLPKNSLLSDIDKNLKIQNIVPMDVSVDIADSIKDITIDSKAINAKAHLNDKKIDAQVSISTLKTYIKGILDGKIDVDTKISSIQNLNQTIQSVYKLNDIPNIDGDLSLNLNIDKLKDVKLNLSSNEISIKDKDKTTKINDIALQLAKKDDKIVLNSYHASYDKLEIFATKPSIVDLQDTNVLISSFWINDKLLLNGNYDTKKAQGEIKALAKMLHISHELIDLDSDIDITTTIEDEQINVDGEIVLEGGDIHYDVNKKTFASDDDIIILQHQKKKKDVQKDNLNINLQISSKKPLVLNQNGVNMKADVDLMINKQGGSDPMMVGAIELQKGGVYMFEDKRFVLDKSYIYFTGDINKPYLDITVKYKSINYLIKIMVSGTPDMPVISFSSQPQLSKEQILSVILFDSEEAAGNKSGEDMMRMMGGAMAKSALSSMGVKLDHLVIGEGNSIEVGKKIAPKTTVIYISGEVPIVKVKYEHTNHLESVISASEKSQSYDIVYKNDYEDAKDIIFMGK